MAKSPPIDGALLRMDGEADIKGHQAPFTAGVG